MKTSLKKQKAFLAHTASTPVGLVVQALQEAAVLDEEERTYSAKFLVLLDSGTYMVAEIYVHLSRQTYSCEDWEAVRDGTLATLGISFKQLNSAAGRVQAQSRLVGRVISYAPDLRGITPHRLVLGYGDSKHEHISITIDQYLNGLLPHR